MLDHPGAGLLVGLAIFGILAGVVMLLTSPQGRVNSRVRQFVAGEGRCGGAQPGGARTSPAAQRPVLATRRPLGTAAHGQALVTELERAGLQSDGERVAAAAHQRGGGPGAVPALLAGPIWWLVAAAGLVPGLAVAAQLSAVERTPPLEPARQRSCRTSSISWPASIRTGSSLFQALDRIAREAAGAEPPEYLRVVRAISLARRSKPRLRRLAERMPTEDIDMLITAIAIQQQTGGNLGQILDLIATTVRERHRIQREIQVLSAPARSRPAAGRLAPRHHRHALSDQPDLYRPPLPARSDPGAAHHAAWCCWSSAFSS